MKRAVVIGGGWSGCSAALAARKAGADVVLLEKTDLLLGLGNVGGIMRNNGRFTAAEENIALGAGELFAITDGCSRHRNLDFPGHKHASLYDVRKAEPRVRRLLEEKGVMIRTISRAVDVEQEGGLLKAILLADGTRIEGDVFIETTGSTGPMGNCLAYGNGCCMCILRCPAFGPRVSITQKAGKTDLMGSRADGSFGAFSGSCKLDKGSLSREIREELDEKGVVVLKLPPELVNRAKLDIKVCRQYALPEYAENIILLDTGHAKLMTPFFPLEQLRRVPGLEDVRFVDPYAGGKGNSIRYLSVAERQNDLQVRGLPNLFCGGEKSGLFVGHTEAITTGNLAGWNAARYLKGLRTMELPEQLATGDIISYTNRRMETAEGLRTRYTFAGDHYFQRMKERGLYSADPEEIARRVKRTGLAGIFQEKVL
ncbi:MAG: FAD-dependent oxidoreductase [Clostridiales bacterium]|nr:FAD-dependent oxidoreductase [Clostridiales bacterium]